MYATECYIDTNPSGETEWTQVLTYYQDGTVERGPLDLDDAYLIEELVASAERNGLDITTAEHYHIIASVLMSKYNGPYSWARHYEVE